jgi:hypothetical protein
VVPEPESQTIADLCGPGSGSEILPAVLSVADPDPGSGMKNPDHISECLETVFFGVKILIFFEADPGSGMEQIRIQDGKN